MKCESGRSMIEMIAVLMLIGMITTTAIRSYQSGQDQNEANKITELVSIASLNGLTKIRNLPDSGEHNVWDVMGKKKADYKCVSSLQAKADGRVVITFKDSCSKIKKALISQWGSSHASGSGNTYTYTPPKDEE